MSTSRKDAVTCSYCGLEFAYEYNLELCPNCDGEGELENGKSCNLCGGTGSFNPDGDVFLCPECKDYVGDDDPDEYFGDEDEEEDEEDEEIWG
jgi:RecJ-like exonuclease